MKSISIILTLEERFCIECTEAAQKHIFVRGHFRVINGKKVYVKAHYRKR